MAWQGIFASVIKDNKSAKSRNGHEAETQDCRKGIEELSAIFSTTNFARDIETEEKNVSNEDDDDLNIGNSSLSILKTISRLCVVLAPFTNSSFVLLVVRQMT